MRRRLTGLVAWGIVGAASGVARAEDHVAVPASGGLAALDARVDLAARVVRFDAGSRHGEVAIDLAPGEVDAASGAAAKNATVERVAIGEGKSVVRVRVPSRTREGVAWEAILAGREPAVVWSGVTGWAHGEEGEYTGTALAIEERDESTKFVIVGDVRQDLAICGQGRSLLGPMVLDAKTMQLRGATIPRLPAEQREEAERVIASAHTADRGPAGAPLARLLVAIGGSSSVGAPAALTDGDPATTWSEGRPGDGHGEFVTMRAAAEVPIARLAIAIAPPAPSAHGAAPRTLYLVTDSRTIAVTLPEDGWLRPGAAYDVPLVEPLRTSCLSVVLDKAYARPGEAHPEVTLAEITAYSAFDAPGAKLDDVAKAMSGGGARAQAASGVLLRAGDAGLAAAAKAYPSLDAPGRALAIDAAIGAGTCASSAGLFVAAMGDADREVARKGREKVERCGKAAAPGLVQAVRGPDMAMRASAATLLASVAPGAAVEPLAGALGQGPPATRAAVRAGLAKAARGATRETLVALVTGAGPAGSGPAGGGENARIELLRALESELPKVAPEADAAIAKAASADASMRARYLLVGPTASLARAGDASATARLGALVSSDADPAVRAHAAESSAGIAALAPVLAAAVSKDDAPRVREAALRALAGAPSLPVDVLSARLASDEWTFVRAAAAEALGGAPASPAVDDALLHALEDSAASVRELAIGALAAHVAGHAAAGATAKSALAAIRARLADPREAPSVRIAAARAAATTCDAAAADTLTDLASHAPLPFATDAEIQVGLAAVDALGHLHPRDLKARLAPFTASDARAESQAAAARALASPGTCR